MATKIPNREFNILVLDFFDISTAYYSNSKIMRTIALHQAATCMCALADR